MAARGRGSARHCGTEYVVTVENHGEQARSIDSAALADPAGTQYVPGSNPWALEKQSKKLEKQYRDHGQAFIRAAGPGVLITGVGAAAAAATAGGGWAIVSPASARAAVAVVVVCPCTICPSLESITTAPAVMTEFKRQATTADIAPGESHTGSLFFPMVRKSRLADAAIGRAKPAATRPCCHWIFLKSCTLQRHL